MYVNSGALLQAKVPEGDEGPERSAAGGEVDPGWEMESRGQGAEEVMTGDIVLDGERV